MEAKKSLRPRGSAGERKRETFELIDDDRRWRNNGRMSKVPPLLIFVVLLTLGSRGVADPKPDETRQEQEIPLTQLIEQRFTHWDRNHNGILELEEVDREVESPSVRGREAAVIFCIRRHLTAKDSEPRISHDDLLKLADDRSFVKSVAAALKKLETIDRDPFLPTDPDLSTFHQGRIGDCYLLATIAAEAHRSPKALRAMIQPGPGSGFVVDFADGQKVKVASLTDCELLVGAKMDSKHGIWLAVLEKAEGIIRARKREHDKESGKATKPTQIVPAENLGGGSALPIISLLTGHQAKELSLRKTASSEEVNLLLVDLTKKRRLMCVSEHVDSGKHPPGIVNKHVYALLGYDSKLRQLTIFNPWGNTFTPTGPPGIANGYTTEKGVFTVPLDEFRQVFTSLDYETGKPLVK